MVPNRFCGVFGIDFIDEMESETSSARRFSREAERFIDGITEGMEERGEIPADLDLPRWVRGDLEKEHEKALDKQNKIWADYQTDFEGDNLLECLYDSPKSCEHLGRVERGPSRTAYLSL